MNTEKWRTGNHGLLSEADRTMYGKKDTVSRSIIDRERTHLNYNLCPHEQYTMGQIKDINRKIRGKVVPKNAIAWGGTVVSLPKDYTGDTQAFFRTAYEGLKRLYKLKDEDIISAYVHMDETTPHMHFYFIPIKHGEKDCINWNKVMPKWMYDTQHQVLQKYMEDKLHTPVNIRNGETKGIDMTHMTAEERQLSMRVEKLKKSVSSLRRRETAAVNAVEALDNQLDDKGKQLAEMDKQIDAKGKQLKDMDAAQARFKESLSEWVESHNGLQRVLRAAPRLSQPHRDKIETHMEQAVSRGDAVLSDALDDVDSILRAAAELERGKRVFDAGKRAVKGNLNIDDLLKDDGFDLC